MLIDFAQMYHRASPKTYSLLEKEGPQVKTQLNGTTVKCIYHFFKTKNVAPHLC